MGNSVQQPFEFATQTIKAGTRQTVNLPLSLLSDHTPMTIPVHVVHGREEGPRLFLSAAIHGDELNARLSLVGLPQPSDLEEQVCQIASIWRLSSAFSPGKYSF